jgi:predicted ester cyclase
MPKPHPSSPPPPVTTIVGRDISELLAPVGGRRQALHGFDDDYVDIVDYIVRCTHRIWEEKRVNLIRTHYSPDCRLHALGGDVHGAESVVENTTKTLAAFPDRSLFADNVIWTGNDRNGFYTSHRITSHMTNLGASEFGPPTGRRATVTTIADCVVRANRIVEEWLVRDNFSLVLQLGLDPHAVAQTRALALGPGQPPSLAGHVELAGGGLEAPEWLPPAEAGPCDAACQQAADSWRTLWNGRDFSAVRDVYSPTCPLWAPSGRALFGHGEIIGWYLHVLGALGDARTRVAHVCAIPYQGGGFDVAIRWTLDGTHSGPGLHLPPTGHRIHLLGATHWRIVQGLVAEEWTVFDELAVLTQMYRRTS